MCAFYFHGMLFAKWLTVESDWIFVMEIFGSIFSEHLQ